MAATEETLPHGSFRTYGGLRTMQSSACTYKWGPNVMKWCIVMNFEASAWHLASVPTRWYRRMDGISRAEPHSNRWLHGVKDASSWVWGTTSRSKLLQQRSSCKCICSDSHNQGFLIQIKVKSTSGPGFSPVQPSLRLICLCGVMGGFLADCWDCFQHNSNNWNWL